MLFSWVGELLLFVEFSLKSGIVSDKLRSDFSGRMTVPGTSLKHFNSEEKHVEIFHF